MPHASKRTFQVVNLDDSKVPKLIEALGKLGERVTLSADGGPVNGTSCKTTGGLSPDDFTCNDSD